MNHMDDEPEFTPPGDQGPNEHGQAYSCTDCGAIHVPLVFLPTETLCERCAAAAWAEL